MSNKIPCGGFYLDDTLNVNDSGELSIKGGTPYQQLVTDGNGNTKWEDRLAYVATDEQVIFSQEDIAFAERNGLYVSSGFPITAINVGDKLRVDFDGDTYVLTAFAPMPGAPLIAIGNGALHGMGDDTGEPFLIQYDIEENDFLIETTLTSPTHTVSITKVVETVHTIPQVYLPKNYRVVFVITHDNKGSSSISCNCSYEELKSFCIGKSVPILGSLFDEVVANQNEVKQLVYINYNENDATIHLQFFDSDGNILKLDYKQDGSIVISPVSPA